MFLKQTNELKKIIDNMKNQGKSDKEIKQVVKAYLFESKKKINTNGDLNVI